MRLIRGLYNIPADFPGCVATIGNFDGVHLGHQAILEQLRQAGQKHALPSVVMMFEPQPREFFAADQAPARLASMAEKLSDLVRQGIDYVLCLPFNQALRSMSADQFVQAILLDGLNIKHLIIGDDFRFGCDRAGDYALLQGVGEQQGFTVADTPTYEHLGDRVSSTRLRECLAANDLAQAGDLLGHPYRMTGRVGYGRQLGRTIDAPTANVLLKRKTLVMSGVYAVEVEIEGPSRSVSRYRGVANLGVKPTVNADQPEPSLEVHLFDFPIEGDSGDLYGQRLSVEFCHKLRVEKKFSGLEALKAAIGEDMTKARDYFTSQV